MNLQLKSKNSKLETNFSRRTFISRLSYLLFLPFAWLWTSELFKLKRPDSTIPKIKFPENLPSGIYFYDSVILVKSENSMRTFQAKCTHLGCKLNKAENGIIICPCHGSRFSSDGKVLSGPADKNLQRLPYSINGNNELVIDETEFE